MIVSKDRFDRFLVATYELTSDSAGQSVRVLMSNNIDYTLWSMLGAQLRVMLIEELTEQLCQA